MSVKGTCQSCSFFVPADQKGMGTCRVNPPTYAQGVCTAFPIVTEYDWCGHYMEDASHDIISEQEPKEVLTHE